jgi:hypothetical protein
MYVEFAAGSSPITLALYRRRALAKVAGVSPDGAGSHRVEIGAADVFTGEASTGDALTDPDGFAWRVTRPAATP